MVGLTEVCTDAYSAVSIVVGTIACDPWDPVLAVLAVVEEETLLAMGLVCSVQE